MEEKTNTEVTEKPVKKVLVVVNMQNDFLTGPLGGEYCRRAIPGCVKLVDSDEFCRVEFALDTHHEDYLETLEGKNLPVVHCIDGTKGHKLCDEITAIVNKRRFSIPEDNNKFAYSKENTFGALGGMWREIADAIYHATGSSAEYHFCGICTSIGVLANAVLCRSLHPNSKIIIHADACGDVNEKMHYHALECLKAQQCEIVED